MKILFICGSLERGKDGVGDYVRKLSAELRELGNEVMLVASNDRYTEVVTGNFRNSPDSNISEIRIPAKVKSRERNRILQFLLKSFLPDWVSIQFVAYSFNKRGLTFKFVKELKQLKTNARIHVMFHEIWQGESRESDIKDKAIGFLQKLSSKALIRQLRVDQVSTSNAYYQHCLMKSGITANIIPVFSNIPKGCLKGKKIYNALPDSVLKNRDQYILACFFGGFHNHDNLAERIRNLAMNIALHINKALLITHIGKSEGVETAFSQLSESTGVTMIVFGQHPENDISDYLKHCDIGLSNHPKILFEKSGSTSAILYNGCPVVILKDSFESDNRQIKGIEEYKSIVDMKKFIEQEDSFSNNYSVRTAANQYNNMFKLNV